MPNYSYPVFTGSIPALITPMSSDGQIDYSALKKLIDWHVQEQSDALVLVGTSGESPTVDMEEHIKIISTAVEHADNRIPIIAGVGGNSLQEAIHLQTQAKKAGAKAGLSVVPYYNKPSQEGIYRHFKAIAEAVDLPTVLYNVPGRTVADMSVETTLRLAEVPGIMGIKDATGDVSRLGALFNHKPDHFQVYSGDDPTAAALILLGGQANISVTANVVPKLMHDMCMAAVNKDVAQVQNLNNRLARLNKVLFLEANPIPVKFALYKMGKTELGYRLPMCELSPENEKIVTQALQEEGLI